MQKAAAACGLIYPILFNGVVIALTLRESDFLRLLGWDPIRRPTQDWPSGLALGPDGWLMQMGFILTGLLLSSFAVGMRRAFLSNRDGRRAATLMALGGAAMLLLVSPTDPTLSAAPPTLHGRLHDLAFVLLGLTLFPAMILWGRAFRTDPKWRSLGVFTWLVTGLVVPYFFLKGAAIYPFLAAVLAWGEIVAIRLWKTAF